MAFKPRILKILGNPNLWLCMENSIGNPLLSTQETQHVTLDREEYRKPITEHTGNLTCDSWWRIVHETHHWAHRKPNLLLWMENLPGNPTCDSGWRRVQETHHWAHRKPNLWLWMEKSTGNPSLSTQETQPVTLDGEQYRKPILWSQGNCNVAVYIYIHLFLCFSYLFHFK